MSLPRSHNLRSSQVSPLSHSRVRGNESDRILWELGVARPHKICGWWTWERNSACVYAIDEFHHLQMHWSDFFNCAVSQIEPFDGLLCCFLSLAHLPLQMRSLFYFLEYMYWVHYCSYAPSWYINGGIDVSLGRNTLSLSDSFINFNFLSSYCFQPVTSASDWI